MKKRLLSVILAAVILLSATVPALAASAEDASQYTYYTVTKISNPDRGEREVDGLIEGGDRTNSYAWSMAARGDMIYIATSRDFAGALVDMYAPDFEAAGISYDKLWTIIDTVTNGDIPRRSSEEGANIISYDRTTGEFEIIYTAGRNDYFCSAVTFGHNVYFGSYSADPLNPQYILKLDPEGNFTKVFFTVGSVSLRANCVYGDHLFFAGTDFFEEVALKLAVLRKSSEDDTVWERVADYKDFGDLPYDSILSSWAGSPVWELASHNGYIYATTPSTNGFCMYKGHPAEDGETANEYGWYWEEVVGLTNGVNNPGLSDYQCGDPGTMRSLVGSVFESNGELYAYNFDHSFAGEAVAFAGMLRQLGGGNVKASDYLRYLYDTLNTPQKIWKLNDETGRFEELSAFTDLVYGTTNEYVWRLGEYDGSLYAATMDAGIIYSYLTQLTNGSFIMTTPGEMIDRMSNIAGVIAMLASMEKTASIDLSPVKDAIKDSMNMIGQMITSDISGENIKDIYRYYNEVMSELERGLLLAMKIVRDSAGAPDVITDMIMSSDTTDKLIDGSLNIASVIFKNVDVTNIIPAELTNEATEKIVNILSLASAAAISYSDSNEDGKEFYRAAIKSVVQDYLNSAVRSAYYSACNFIDSLDIEGIRMYICINDMVVNNDWGFDLFRSDDGGESFEVITSDGFGDKYNYGCSSFLETEEGLYIGTCNPFYGAQLYLLTNYDEPEPDEPTEPDGPTEPTTPSNPSKPTEAHPTPAEYILGDVDGSGKVNVFDASSIMKGITGTRGYPDYAKLDKKSHQYILADADGNGAVNIFDAALILRYASGDASAKDYGIGNKISG